MARKKSKGTPVKLDDRLQERRTPQQIFDFKQNYADWDGKVESDLRSDVRKVIEFYSDTFFETWIQDIMDYSMSWIQRRLEKIKHWIREFSNMKQPIIKTFTDRVVKWIYRTNFSLKMLSVKNNKTVVKTLQSIAERFYATSKMKKTLQEVAKSATLNGNGYYKLIFNTPNETKEFLRQLSRWEANPIEITSAPVRVEWVSEFDLFYDPSEPLNGDQTFVVYRSIKSINSVLEDAVQKLDEYVDRNTLAYVCNNPAQFDDNNYNLIRNIIYYEKLYLDKCKTDKSFDVNNFIQMAKDNKKVEYIEIWERERIYILINWWLVWSKENPLKSYRYRHPFFGVYLDKIPWTWTGIGMWTSLRNIQRWYDSLFNMIFDNAKKCADPMIEVGAWAFDPDFQWEWGKVTEQHVEFVSPPPLNSEVINALQNLLEMASFMVTPASYWDYQTQSRSATDSNFRTQSLNDSIIMLADAITDSLNLCFESLLEQMKDKMPDKFLLPISKKAEQQWATISKEDIELNTVYEWSSDSIREADRESQRAQVNEFLNWMLSVASDETWRTVIDRENLVKYFIDLWDLPEDILKTKQQFFNDMKEAQVKQAEAQVEVAQIQQEAQAEAQAEAQQEQMIGQELWPDANQSDIDFVKQMMSTPTE